MENNIRIGLFGAAPDTTNMGVSALFSSTVSGISRLIPNVEFLVLDYGFGRRDKKILLPDGRVVPVILFGARIGRRYYRPENLTSMLAASKLGKFGAILNQGIQLIDSCKAILDISGGDSFSDIYGIERFNGIYTRKLIALNRKVPLILLPQTYGPYFEPRALESAKYALKESTACWARDANSFKILKELLGESFDPGRHHCGVDMAFGLMAQDATNKLNPEIQTLLRNKSSDKPLFGINVSGLIFNDPATATNSYGFKTDYKRVILGLLNWIFEHTQADILLVPHVMDMPGHFESDMSANQEILLAIPDQYKGRIFLSPNTLNESEAKWLISQFDWFCGTRMHSTIAALSSGVATATISYSDKALGIFEVCGQGAQVFDPRKLDEGQILSGLENSFMNRKAIRSSLTQQLPKVMQALEMQMKLVVENILALR